MRPAWSARRDRRPGRPARTSSLRPPRSLDRCDATLTPPADRRLRKNKTADGDRPRRLDPDGARGADHGAAAAARPATPATRAWALAVAVVGRDQPAVSHARQRTAAARRAARPRWLMASFCSSRSSAIVQPVAGRRRAGTPGRSRSRARRAERSASRPLQRPSKTRSTPLRGIHVGDRAHVLEPAAGGRLAQQLVQVLLVAGVLPRVAGRAHPGRAAERLGRDAGVIGDRDLPVAARRRAGLAERVLRERIAVLGRQLDSCGARRSRRRRPAAARTRGACARCGSPAAASSPVGPPTSSDPPAASRLRGDGGHRGASLSVSRGHGLARRRLALSRAEAIVAASLRRRRSPGIAVRDPRRSLCHDARRGRNLPERVRAARRPVSRAQPSRIRIEDTGPFSS